MQLINLLKFYILNFHCFQKKTKQKNKVSKCFIFSNFSILTLKIFKVKCNENTFKLTVSKSDPDKVAKNTKQSKPVKNQMRCIHVSRLVPETIDEKLLRKIFHK